MPVRTVLAILSHASNRIGLFEKVRIHQEMNGEGYYIEWLKPVYGSQIRPRVQLLHDSLDTMHHDEMYPIQHIQVVSTLYLRLNRQGSILPNIIQPSTLGRMPFLIQCSGYDEQYPVYTLHPDEFLPWNHTVMCPLYGTNNILVNARHPRVQNYGRPRAIPRSLSASAICPITRESITMSSAVWTPCRHAFSMALAEALERDPRCPVCRSGCTFEECDIY